jgi:hypothetical protein
MVLPSHRAFLANNKIASQLYVMCMIKSEKLIHPKQKGVQGTEVKGYTIRGLVPLSCGTHVQ